MPGQEVADIGLHATDALADELVEVADHLAVGIEVLGRRGPDGLAHALHELVQHLGGQPLDQRIEALARRRLHEVVVAQVADLLADVRRQGVQLIQAFGGGIAEHLPEVGARRVARGAVQPLLHARALLLDDLAELAPDVAEHVVQPEPLAQLLAPLAQSIHEVLEAGHVRSRRVAALPATLHEPAQGRGEVALGHHVVGQGSQDLVGVEVGQLLAAVPAREPGVPRQRGHAR